MIHNKIIYMTSLFFLLGSASVDASSVQVSNMSN